VAVAGYSGGSAADSHRFPAPHRGGASLQWNNNEMRGKFQEKSKKTLFFRRLPYDIMHKLFAAVLMSRLSVVFFLARMNIPPRGFTVECVQPFIAEGLSRIPGGRRTGYSGVTECGFKGVPACEYTRGVKYVLLKTIFRV
jgi:hypothetical protein